LSLPPQANLILAMINRCLFTEARWSLSAQTLKAPRLLLSLGALSALCSCVDEDTLSVYGLAERYDGSLTLELSSCQSSERGLSAAEAGLQLSLKQTEGAALELWFEGYDTPLYAELCRAEDETPLGLCLYGRQLEAYQVASLDPARAVSCQLWSELAAESEELGCCERVALEALNTLSLSSGGELKGSMEFRLSLSSGAESTAEPASIALCGGPLDCRYRASLMASPRP